MTFLKNAEHSRRLPSEAQRTIGLQTGPGLFSKFLRGGLGRVLRHQINHSPSNVSFRRHTPGSWALGTRRAKGTLNRLPTDPG